MYRLQAVYVVTGNVCTGYRQRMYRLQAMYIVTGNTPLKRVSTPAGRHESLESLRTVLWDGRSMCLIDHHEEDLPHRQALEQTGPGVHLPHCITP